MPRETEKHSSMMIGGKRTGGQRPGRRNQDGRGTTKSDDFFLVSEFRTLVVATTVCDGRCTHSVSHAHFSDTFSLGGVRTSRTRTAQGVCSAHVISLHSHISSAVFSVLAQSLPHLLPVCTFLADLFPIRKRRSNALPHERCLATWPIPRTPQGWCCALHWRATADLR